MSLQLIIADADGCFVKEEKQKRPALIDIGPQEECFKQIKAFFIEHPELKFSMSTTRSLSAGLRVADEVGINTLSAVDGGTTMYNPQTGEVYFLTETPEYEKHAEALQVLQAWSNPMNGREAYLAEPLGIDAGELRKLDDRKTIFTVEMVNYHNPPISGYEIWDSMKENGQVTKQILSFIENGQLILKTSRAAVDVQIPIKKHESTIHTLEELGILRDNALGIGDRMHSDPGIMDNTRFVACPSNADDALKKYVQTRGKDGFVSAYEVGEGFLDILRHAEAHWMIGD